MQRGVQGARISRMSEVFAFVTPIRTGSNGDLIDGDEGSCERGTPQNKRTEEGDQEPILGFHCDRC